MRLILNADDFGMDADTTRATIACFERRALTSATIMPNMPATAEAVAYARSRPDLSFGVHLTYLTDTVEAPLCPPASIPTLAEPTGRFKNSQRLRLLALTRRVRVADIAAETRAQIQRLLDLGVNISHVDSHGHLHKFAPFVRALAAVLPSFNITRVRRAQNVYVTKPVKSPNYWFGPTWGRAIAARFRTTDLMFMPGSGSDHDGWEDTILARLGKPADTAAASIEVGVHPGTTEAWRVREGAAIARFADAARGLGHEVIGWREL